MVTSKIKIGTRERDKLFKKDFSELKIRVVLNWFEILALLVVSFFITLKIVSFFELEGIVVVVLISTLSSAVITYIFCQFRKYKLFITRFDKEDIYKKISAELIDESKKEGES